MTVEQLAAAVDDLRGRIRALEQENATLRRSAARTTYVDARTPSPMSRRALLRGVGWSAAAGAGAVAVNGFFSATPASATLAAMYYGAANDAGSDSTSLTSDNDFDTLLLVNTGDGSSLEARSKGGGAAVDAISEKASFPAITASVAAGATGSGAALEAAASNATSSAIEAYVTNVDNVNPAILVEHTKATGFGLEATVPSGAPGSHAAIHAEADNMFSTAVLGEVRNTGSGAPGVNGLTLGTGVGIWGSAYGTAGTAGVFGVANNKGAGVWGQSNSFGNDDGVYGEAIGPSGSGAGVHGKAFGKGAGISGESVNGRGAVVSGKRAQLRLVPSSSASHPTSGSKGDVFVDASTRLWFCKGGATWIQLA